MNHYLQKAAGAISVTGLFCLSAIALSTAFGTITAFAQPSKPPQPSQSDRSALAKPAAPATPSGKPSNPAGRWQKFRFPEGRFIVALPQEPVKTSEKDSDGDISYIYKVERDQDFYVVSHIDIESLKQVSPSKLRDLLQKMPADLVKAIDGRLVSTKKMSLRKNPGQEFDFLIAINGKESSGKGRIYVIGTRVYTLISVGNPKDLSRFLNSFNPI
jgi:hypothetical protein